MRWSIEELIYSIKIVSNHGFPFLFRLKNIFRSIWRSIKVITKWVFKGYCNPAIWDLDEYLITVITQRLRMFKKMNVNSYPAGLKDDTDWRDVLNRLIHGFEVMKSESIYLEVLYKEEDPEAAYRLQSEYDSTTMELFVKYLRDLWD